MGTLVKRSNGWQCKVRKKGYPAQSKTFQYKADAEAWGREVENLMDKGMFIAGPLPSDDEPQISTVEDLLKEYTKLESVKKADGGAADKNRIKPVIAALGKFSIHALTSKQVSVYREQRLGAGMAPQTVRHELNVLHRAYVVAVEEWGVNLRTTIPRAKKPPTPRGRITRLRPKQVEALKESTQSELLGSIIDFAIETCMRRQEIVRMQWEDVNMDQESLYIPRTKTDEPRTVPLSPKALQVLKALPHREGQVFRMSMWSISQAFKRAADRIGMQGVVFHSCRHEGISRLFEKGLSVIEVSRISGHKTLSQLDRYTHLDVAHLNRRIRA